MRPFFLVAAVAGLAGVACGAQSTESGGWVTFPNGTKVGVEMADTEATRARGLMFRRSLALWLDQSGRIVSIAHSAPPCTVDPCPSYPPGTEARAVVEVVAGFATQHRVKVGDVVKIDGATDFKFPGR